MPTRIVAPRVDGQAQLGADAVGSRHQHGLAVAIQRHLDQGAEAADAAQHLAAHGAPHVRLDALDQFLAGVDVDSGFAIGYGGSLSHSDPQLCADLGSATAGRRGGSASCGILHDDSWLQHSTVLCCGDISHPVLRPWQILCLALCRALGRAELYALTRAELYQATAPFADRSEAAPDRRLPDRHEDRADPRHRAPHGRTTIRRWRRWSAMRAAMCSNTAAAPTISCGWPSTAPPSSAG